MFRSVLIACLALATTLWIAAPGSAATQKRLALVIGNGGYLHTRPLRNPVNDAQAMANKLESLGFETYTGFDLDKYGMERLLRDFTRASRSSDLNVFFYAGHGVAVEGTNYLVPVDAVFEDETALDFEAVPVDFVTRQMSNADAVNLVFLDACRDNPLKDKLSRSFGSTRSATVGSGLAEMKVSSSGKGMAIAFATSPGNVAHDGDGENSPFTSALLRHLDAENTDIAEVFTRVTGDVYEATEQAQRPWLNVSLTGPVMLNEVNRVQEVAVNNSASEVQGTVSRSGGGSSFLQEQKLLFDLARETGDPDDYRAYLESFPDGLYANNARRTIRKLEGAAVRTTSVSQGSQTQLTPSQPLTRAATANETGPLVLQVTQNIRMMPTSKATEAELDLNRTSRGNIQARLNASGANVGGVDGQWGPKTRRGISYWQGVNGLTPTGYLNRAQYEILIAQTEGQFTPYVAPVARASSTLTRRKSSNNNSNNNALGSAILGIAIGTILAK